MYRKSKLTRREKNKLGEKVDLDPGDDLNVAQSKIVQKEMNTCNPQLLRGVSSHQHPITASPSGIFFHKSKLNLGRKLLKRFCSEQDENLLN